MTKMKTYFVPATHYLDMKQLGLTPVSHLMCVKNESGTTVDGYELTTSDAAIVQELGVPIERWQCGKFN